MFDVLNTIPEEYIASFVQALDRPFSAAAHKEKKPAAEPVLIPCKKNH